MTVNSESPSPRSGRPYGADLADSFGAESAPYVLTRSLPHAELAVTEIKVLKPSGQLSIPPLPQNAYMVIFELDDLKGMEYWEEGRHVLDYDLRAGDTTIHDLR